MRGAAALAVPLGDNKQFQFRGARRRATEGLVMDDSVGSRSPVSQRPPMAYFPGGMLVLFPVCFFLSWAKCPDSLLNPQFWAEDGAIFYAQQFGRPAPLLFTSYSGYLHFVPRLVAWLLTGVDAAHAPFAYNLAALVVGAFCIAYAITRMSPLFGGAVALLAFFLTPTVGDQFGTPTNIQWLGQFALIFAVLNSKQSRPYRPLDAAPILFVLALALTGPFSIIDTAFIFLAWGLSLAGRGWSISRPYALAVARIVTDIDPVRLGALVLGAAAQTATAASHNMRTPVEAYTLTMQDMATLGVTKLNTVYMYTMLGVRDKEQLLLGVVYAFICIVVFVSAIRQPRTDRLIKLFLLTIGVAQPVIAHLKQGNFYTYAVVSRYFYFLGVVAFCCAATTLLSMRGKYRFGAITAAIVCLALYFVWRPLLLVRPPFVDMNWPAYAARISAGDHNVLVPLNPSFRAVINPD
jgi:hypothetical protein